MKSIAFLILNTLGCAVLTSLVAFQWSQERASHRVVENLKLELAGTKITQSKEHEKSAALEQDISVLKETIESTRQAADDAAKIIASRGAETTQLQADLIAARAQGPQWQAALAARDAKLKELNAELIFTRRRLDEAIAKLKQAGAR